MSQCPECGASLTACPDKRKHKDAWNNRRKKRGAQLYDLLMAHRFQRDETGDQQLWSKACSLMAEWHAEDKSAGRPQTWRNYRKVLSELTWLKATRIG